MKTAYESGQQKCIPATLVYAWYPLGSERKYLLIKKKVKEGDPHSGKVNGLGGKSEVHESYRECAVREFGEESMLKLDAERFLPVGNVLFPNFKPKKSEDWNVWIYKVKLTLQEALLVPSANEEGNLIWVEESEILKQPLWKGDEAFLPSVFSERPFVGTIWYQSDGNIRSEILPLS